MAPVILIDINLLVFAYMAPAPEHDAARGWLDSRLNGAERVGLPWSSLVGFMRIATNGRIYKAPARVDQAWQQVQEWLDCPGVWIPEPGPDHRAILGRLLANLGGGHRLIPDADLAALAIEHGLVLCSADGDFARFKGLRWENPLKLVD